MIDRRVPCPHCRSLILEGARKCKSCKQWVDVPSDPPFPRAAALLATALATVTAVIVTARKSPVGEAPPLTALPTDSASAMPGGAPDSPGQIGPAPDTEAEPKPIDPAKPWRLREIKLGDIHPLDVAWNPSGQSLYVSGDDGTLREYKAKTGEMIHKASVPAQGDQIRLLFDRWIAVLRHQDAARIPVMDTTTWDRDPMLLDVGAGPGDIVAMPDGRTVVAASMIGKRVTRFDLPTGTRLADITLPHATGQLFVARSEGRTYIGAMGSLTHSGQPGGAWIDLFDPNEEPFGATRRSISIGREPREGRTTRDGSALFFPDRVANTAVLLRVSGATEAKHVAVDQGPSAGFLLDDDRYGVTINAAARTATVIALPSMEVKASLMLSGVPCSGEVTPDGKTLFVSLGGTESPPKGTGVAVIAGDPPKVVASMPTAKGACNLAISKDGSRVAIATYHAKAITILEQ
jgi:DNA-binding beta-propeller fold protein YncE